ncbi:MAG TPA: GH116 family glycosyl-hydrolase [Sumerlaeia bacterium]|nr:GH116 family glycosyl-hydrolase [Sumerlaeia bacterium]
MLALWGTASAGADPAGDYAKTVLGEEGLLGYWRMEGDLKDAKGAAHGKACSEACKGESCETGCEGEAAFAEGAVGGKAVALQPKQFLCMGATPHLDSPETTLELFFQFPAPPSGNYNPCVICKRNGVETRFSVHLMRDSLQLATWNGSGITVIAPPEGKLQPGRWYHLAIAASGSKGRAYVDGLPCRIQAGGSTLTEAKKGLPLFIGASSTEGAEQFVSLIDEVAVYDRMLTDEEVARHVDAAGWAERRQKFLAEQRRRETEERERRARKLAERESDPALFALGEQRVYEGERLGAISLPVGGIGAGVIQMNGKAQIAIWQIFNNYKHFSVPHSFFAVRAKSPRTRPVVRALQTEPVGAFRAAESLRFRGEYPFGWYDFEDRALPVRVTMEVFNPLIPLQPKESAIPCAIFNLTAENPTRKEVEVSFLAAQQNPVGFTDDAQAGERTRKGYGGNRNRVISATRAAVTAAGGRATMLRMTQDAFPGASAAKGTPSSGDMTLMAIGGDATTGDAAWDSLDGLLKDFGKDGDLENQTDAGPSPTSQTIDGALATRFQLKPGEKRTATFALTWHFPNGVHGGLQGWQYVSHMYTNWWENSLQVAQYLEGNLDELTAQTRLYHDTFYETNLPRWLLDRVSSQVAVLHSKTCFWAKNGHFGAWEGCCPDRGCCHGSCTHVWHYAQAHARLFPSLARAMREATYSLQKPDGALPHRHPAYPPAADGHFGDILGAYREHLCSADDDWLKAWWPKIKRAMEFGIAQWDADEDGVLAGAQHNTLDGSLGGNTSWIGTLYLAALQASARMARLQGEEETAQSYLRIWESGAKRQNETLWNGEYYQQIPDPEPRSDYADGCAIDQVLGEWWANQAGLDTAYPADRVRAALRSLVKYNFRADFHGIHQAPRKFVDDDDAGLQMIQWPRNPRPVPTILYGDEVMTGFEYAAAATILHYGLIEEALLVAKAVSDRYDGRLRTGLTGQGTASWGYSGNPFGDDECGKFYARAMSVWSLLLAAQGFVYDGPAARIGFRPAWRPEDHASFFTGAEGWGLFSQRREEDRQRETINVRQGKLDVKELVFQLPAGTQATQVGVEAQGRPHTIAFSQSGQTLQIELENLIVLRGGESVDVTIAWRKQ